MLFLLNIIMLGSIMRMLASGYLCQSMAVYMP